jgi:hypothetical protein
LSHNRAQRLKALAPQGIETLLIEAIRELVGRCEALEKRLAAQERPPRESTLRKPARRSKPRAT